MTFNISLKACFSNKKYLITIQTRPTQIVKVYFLIIEKPNFNGFFKIIYVQNHKLFRFNNTLRAKK